MATARRSRRARREAAQAASLVPPPVRLPNGESVREWGIYKGFETPLVCGRCGIPHFQVHSCRTAREMRYGKQTPAPPVYPLLPRIGMHPWKQDRLETIEHLGGNVFVRKRG